MNAEWLYHNSDDNSRRYVLGTVGSNTLICVGVNPSTAEPDHPDNTIRSVMRVAAENRYDSWIMVNLYPQRSADPDDLDDVCNEEFVSSNINHIEELLLEHQNSDIWAAWGTAIEKRAYLTDCLERMVAVSRINECRWFRFGDLSKKGHPHHPLYLKADSPKDPFDVVAYLDRRKRQNM